jgi:hypothetical protein
MLIFVVLSSLGLWVSGTKTVLSDVVRAANGRFVSGCETFVPVGKISDSLTCTFTLIDA